MGQEFKYHMLSSK